MNSLILSRPLLAFVVGTRAALAFGIGLLVADRIPEDRRRAIALSLVGIGLASTIPAAMAVFGKNQNRRAPMPLTAPKPLTTRLDA
jgi:hypothetical protein